jgi:hypothetical protein
MNIRPLLLLLVGLFMSSLALAQEQQSASGQQGAAQGQQQQQAAAPKASPTAVPTPTPTVIGVSTYQKDQLCFGGTSEHPKCEAGIGDKIIVQIKNLPTAIKAEQLVVFLDGQPIKGKENFGVPVRGGEIIPIQNSDKDVSLVEFQLNRTEESRAAWTSLLGSPGLNPRRPVTVSVGKPDDQPFLRADENKPIELRSYYRGWLIGMLLFVIAAVLIFFLPGANHKHHPRFESAAATRGSNEAVQFGVDSSSLLVLSRFRIVLIHRARNR